MNSAIPPWARSVAKALLAVLIIGYVAAIGIVCLWQFTQGRSGIEIGAVAFSLLYVVKTIGSFAGQHVPDVPSSAGPGNLLGAASLTNMLPSNSTGRLLSESTSTENSVEIRRKALRILQCAIDDENIPAEIRVNAAVAWLQQGDETGLET